MSAPRPTLRYPARMRIVIVGGGIGGLTLAIALQRLGHEPVVLERAPSLQPLGAGLTLQPNALDVYRRLGLADAILEAGAALRGGELRSADGRVLKSLDLADTPGAPSEAAVGIHRGDLLELLGDAAGDVVQWGAPVTDIDVAEPAAILLDVARVGGDAVVGADGIHSAVRQALFGPRAPRYAGYTCWRGVCDHRDDDGLFEAWGRGQRFGAVPIGGGRTYWFATADAPEGGQDDGDPLPSLLTRFAGWAAPVADLLQGTPAGSVLRNDIIDRPPTPRWGRGPVTLLGDAAHPMTPNMGQGAGQSIEDAWVLARCVTEGDDAEAAFRAYESERMPRTRWMVERSESFGKVGQWSHPAACWLRDRAVSLAPASAGRAALLRAVGHRVR